VKNKRATLSLTLEAVTGAGLDECCETAARIAAMLSISVQFQAGHQLWIIGPNGVGFSADHGKFQLWESGKGLMEVHNKETN
jgi:ABC-type cobalamin transport system ATPase subunit